MRSRLRREIAELHPGYAAWVMATGIVSTGFAVVGRRTLSRALLVLACAELVVLLLAYGGRIAQHGARVLADACDPARGFGYLSVVAAIDVVALRVALDHHSRVTLALAAVSAPLWLVLTYAIPAAMVFGRRATPVLSGLNGSWFLWVVATQSQATTAATLALLFPGHAVALGSLAVALWGVGVVLYLVLAAVVTVRVLDRAGAPHALGPTYWIYMGAAAISVLAAGQILRLPATLPVLHATHEVVSGVGFILWAFATWWIPLLLALLIWQLIRHEVPRYDATWWSAVFPLGMYAVASVAYGRATGLGFLAHIGRVEVWFAFAGWLVVSAAMIGSVLPSRR